MPGLILCYHKVGPGAEEGRSLNVEPADLARQARFVARRWRVATVADFDLDHGAALTFDDLYRSAARHATDVLDRLGVKGTFYAVPGRTESDWDPTPRPLASPEERDALRARGHEVGNHTWSHVRLGQADDPMAEVERAHAALNARSFCYPWGDGADDPGARTAVAAHYARAVSLKRGRPSRVADPLALPRLVVAYSDGLAGLLYKLYVRPRLPQGIIFGLRRGLVAQLVRAHP